MYVCDFGGSRYCKKAALENLEEDSFKTFIPAPPSKSQTLDLQKMMLAVVRNHSFTMREFWEMPLFLVFELLGMFVSPEKQPISRKSLVDGERKWNMVRGY